MFALIKKKTNLGGATAIIEVDVLCPCISKTYNLLVRIHVEERHVVLTFGTVFTCNSYNLDIWIVGGIMGCQH